VDKVQSSRERGEGVVYPATLCITQRANGTHVRSSARGREGFPGGSVVLTDPSDPHPSGKKKLEVRVRGKSTLRRKKHCAWKGLVCKENN